MYNMGESRIRRNLWGKEWVEHFDDDGNLTGRSYDEVTFFGGKKQVHYDENGAKKGETREVPSGLLGGGPSKFVHYDADGRFAGQSLDHPQFLGGTRRVHYDKQGTQTGHTQEVVGFFGDRRKIHTERSAPGRRKGRGSNGARRFMISLVAAVATLVGIVYVVGEAAQRLS